MERAIKKKEKTKRRDHGVWILRRDDEAYVFMRGTEQPDPNAISAGRAHPVDIGPEHVVALKVSPAELLDLSAVLLISTLGHVKQCHSCAGMLGDLVDMIDEVMGSDPANPPPVDGKAS